MNILDLIRDIGYPIRRKAAAHGGEYSSPCPFCVGGDDRFLIWPHRENTNGTYQGGRYCCRRCNAWGDAIKFQMQINGLTYRESCDRIGLQPNQKPNTQVETPTAKHKVLEMPAEQWLTKAWAFMAWSRRQLHQNPEMIQKLKERGFTDQSIIEFRLGYNAGDSTGSDFFRERQDWGLEPALKSNGSLRKIWLPVGFVIPTFSLQDEVTRLKIRRTQWYFGEKLQKYVQVSGSMSGVSIFGDRKLPIACVVESEFDALLIQQECGDLVYCIALGGSSKPLDQEAIDLLSCSGKILFLPDYDMAGAASMQRFKKLFNKCVIVTTPREKSAGDFIAAGGNLRNWLMPYLQNEPE